MDICISFLLPSSSVNVVFPVANISILYNIIIFLVNIPVACTKKARSIQLTENAYLLIIVCGK